MTDHAALDAWLAERDHADHLAALEAGKTGPDGPRIDVRSALKACEKCSSPGATSQCRYLNPIS
jgi:hypothetical protein